MRFNWFIRLCCLLAFITLGSECSYAASPQCFVLQPPGQVLPGVKKIAILDFKDRYGSALDEHYAASASFSHHLTQALFDKARGITDVKTALFFKKEGRTYLSGARTDIYTLIGREELDHIVKEQKLGASGLVDETQAASIGKLLGADAILVGDIMLSARGVQSTGSDYDPYEKRTVSVSCFTRTAIATVNMKVISVTTGAILCTKTAQTTAEDKKCGSDLPKVETALSLVDRCLVSAADELASAIAPRFVENKNNLRAIDAKAYKEMGKKAREDAEDGKLDEAYAGYAAIIKDDPYNDAVIFNMGVLNEVVGNYQDAQEFYQKPVEIRPNGDYSNALDHCTKMNEYSPSLVESGVSIDKHTFDGPDAEMASATERARLRGDDSERIPLYASADQGSPVVVKVPGGVELEVVERSGDWLRVKTFDGKVAFLRKEDVR